MGTCVTRVMRGHVCRRGAGSRCFSLFIFLFLRDASARLDIMAMGLGELQNNQIYPKIRLKSASDIIESLPLEMMMLERYGCWCFLSDDPMDVLRGKGMPLD